VRKVEPSSRYNIAKAFTPPDIIRHVSRGTRMQASCIGSILNWTLSTSLVTAQYGSDLHVFPFQLCIMLLESTEGGVDGSKAYCIIPSFCSLSVDSCSGNCIMPCIGLHVREHSLSDRKCIMLESHDEHTSSELWTSVCGDPQWHPMMFECHFHKESSYVLSR